MRASIARARKRESVMSAVADQEFAEVVIRSFDDNLERLGTTGGKFDKFLERIENALSSGNHGVYQEGLETLGNLLGYRARRPRHAGAADCVWKGEFGNIRELVTWEAKIEHQPAISINHSDVGRAVAQYNRAKSEYGGRGYVIRSWIVTHLGDIAPEARSALGTVRLVSKDAVLALWRRVRNDIASYRSRWSIDDIGARRSCAAEIRGKVPRTGWLGRVVDEAEEWIDSGNLLRGWGG